MSDDPNYNKRLLDWFIWLQIECAGSLDGIIRWGDIRWLMRSGMIAAMAGIVVFMGQRQ